MRLSLLVLTATLTCANGKRGGSRQKNRRADAVEAATAAEAVEAATAADAGEVVDPLGYYRYRWQEPTDTCGTELHADYDGTRTWNWGLDRSQHVATAAACDSMVETPTGSRGLLSRLRWARAVRPRSVEAKRGGGGAPVPAQRRRPPPSLSAQMLRQVPGTRAVQQLGVLPRARVLCAGRPQAHLRRVLAQGPARPRRAVGQHARRVHGQVPRAPGTPPRAAERALDQRHHQGPGREAQDEWHVERQGSLVIHGRAREPPRLCVLVKVLYLYV